MSCGKTGTSAPFEITPGSGVASKMETYAGAQDIASEGVNKLYNDWIDTCPFSLKDGAADVISAETADDLINYSGDKDKSKRAYDDLMNEIYRRILHT